MGLPRASSSDLGWVRLRRREFLPLPSPEEASRYTYTPQEPEKVASFIGNIAADTQADEVMVTSVIDGRSERFRCYERVAHALGAGPRDGNGD